MSEVPTLSARASIPAAQLTPRIHSASEIQEDATLEATVRNFVNEGYRYIAPKDALRWDSDAGDRLPNADSISRELGHSGFFAVLYDPSDNITPLACAAITPWKGDWEGGGQGDVAGWELKTVTTRLGWMRLGLACICVDALVDELLRQMPKAGEGDGDKLNVWVQTVECVNGAYWKKKGWKEVRGYDTPAGNWGSRYGYRLLVLLQKFDLASR